VKGGAIPILSWATILLVLFVGNFIWDAKPVNAAEAAFAAAIVYALGVALWLARRESIRRGPPEPRAETEAVPHSSLAAVMAGLAAGMILFGLAWAQFFIVFGAGLLVASLGRLVLERRSERATRARVLDERERR
jgi:uncharacterized iron-regulated membrane protein